MFVEMCNRDIQNVGVNSCLVARYQSSPLLYILYMPDLGRILSDNGITSHIYADDTQTYVHGPPAAATTLIDTGLFQRI